MTISATTESSWRSPFELLPIYIFIYSQTYKSEPFYLGRVEDSIGKEALVFASPTMLEALSLGTVIHIDANFNTVPERFYQLMILNVISFDYVSFNYLYFY